MPDSPITGVPLLPENAAGNYVLVNSAILRLEQVAAGRVLDRNLTAPPGSPAEGDAYIVAATATGAWATHEAKIAFYQNAAWQFITPTNGMSVFVVDEKAQFNYSAVESLWYPLQPIWSTSEVWTGRYGSASTMVYQKCFSFALGDGVGSLAVAHSITNLNRSALIEFHGSFSNGTVAYKSPQEFTTATVVQWVNATNILTSNASVDLSTYTCRMRLEYERTA